MKKKLRDCTCDDFYICNSCPFNNHVCNFIEPKETFGEALNKLLDKEIEAYEDK